MLKKTFLLAGLIVFFCSCDKKIDKKDAWTIGLTPCAARPAYVANCPLNTPTAALSTSEKRIKGLVLVDVKTGETWQHESWRKFGSMGPICTDKLGNTFVGPVPVINILENKPEKQNILYKVDGSSGIMKPFIDLPFETLPGDENPYGILGLHYDCHANLVIVSTVLGSDRKTERGKIFIVDPEKEEILDKLENQDVMGMAICGVNGEKRLYFGSTRTSDIYSIEMSKNNTFIGKPRIECNLDMLGPRGDDKARKIVFKQDGSMAIKGISFDYNLTAPTEKLETNYLFLYDRSTKKWVNQLLSN
jgi:hypothetical protein